MPMDMNLLVFFLGNWFGLLQMKNHGCGQKKTQKALPLLYLASGPLRNAANSSVAPTEFEAESTTKMKSSKAILVTLTFRVPPKRQLSILLNFFFPFIDI